MGHVCYMGKWAARSCTHFRSTHEVSVARKVLLCEGTFSLFCSRCEGSREECEGINVDAAKYPSIFGTLVPAVIPTWAHFTAEAAVRKVCKCMQEPLGRQFYSAHALQFEEARATVSLRGCDGLTIKFDFAADKVAGPPSGAARARQVSQTWAAKIG